MKLPETALKISTIALITAALLLTVKTDTESTYTTGKIEVVDGDTLEFNSSGRTDTVRLLGVDTPETLSANNPEEYGFEDSLESRECLSRYASKAENFASEFVGGKTVEISTDAKSDRRGDYGRLLAYVKTVKHDKNLNERLLEEGYARVYSSEFSRREKFRLLEEKAREEDRGLWSCG